MKVENMIDNTSLRFSVRLEGGLQTEGFEGRANSDMDAADVGWGSDMT